MSNEMFKELAAEWMLHQKNYVKESTHCTYSIHMNKYIIPLLGEVKCNDLTSDLLQKYITEQLYPNKNLSCKTIRDIIVILKMCLKYGIKQGYLVPDKVSLTFPTIKVKSNIVQTYSIQEQQIIAAAVLDNLNSRSDGILIGLCTGIRIGELCALKWSDIDLINKSIKINKTLQRIYLKNENGKRCTKITITMPKTSNSIREIPIGGILEQTLNQLKNDNPDAYILTNTDKYIEPRTYRNYYYRFIRDLNIRKLKFHSLRHTFATTCIESGADYKTVSELMGHANVNITMNLYMHPTIDQKRKCISVMDNLFQ